MPKGIYKRDPKMLKLRNEKISKTTIERWKDSNWVKQEMKRRQNFVNDGSYKKRAIEMVKTRTENNSYGFSEETLKMFSRTRQGKGNGMYGKYHTDEARKLQSKAKEGKTYEEIYGVEMAKIHKQRLREDIIKRQIKLFGKTWCPNIGEHEFPILDNLEKQYGYKILRQYRMIGYVLDGYIPKLNIAFEVDEPHHFNTNGELYPYDIKRQKEIENKLGCEFIRIKTEV